MADKVAIEKLMEGLKFESEEQKKTFEAVLSNDANHEVHSRRYLRREEGSKLADAKEKAERAAQAAKEEADREKQMSITHMEELTRWQEEEKLRLANEAKGEIEQFRTKLREKGIDPDSMVGQQIEKQPNGFSKDELRKEFLDINTARSIAEAAIDLPLKMPVIMDRVKKVHGDVPVDWSAFYGAAKANLVKGISIDDTAESIFKISEKEKAQAEEALRKQIRGEMESEFQERLAKMQVPGAAAPVYVNPNDPVFSAEFANKTKESDASQDAAARDHFLQVNAELESQGVQMLNG